MPKGILCALNLIHTPIADRKDTASYLMLGSSSHEGLLRMMEASGWDKSATTYTLRY
jgi:hypothetical protein